MTTLTENTIRSYTSEQSFERGLEYYRSGAIYNAIRQGNALLADCVGTETYHLRVELDEAGIQSANCICSYIVASCLKTLAITLLKSARRGTYLIYGYKFRPVVLMPTR